MFQDPRFDPILLATHGRSGPFPQTTWDKVQACLLDPWHLHRRHSHRIKEGSSKASENSKPDSHRGH